MAEQNSTSSPENPLTASVERLRRELDHWLEVAWQQGERALDKIGVRAGSLSSTPAIDVMETEEEVVVLVDLPGLEPERVAVELTGHMLTVSGERTTEDIDSAKAVHVRERFDGHFRRSIPLPVPVKPDEVEAEACNGVLRVRMPKADVARSKRIPIKAAPKPSSPAVGPEGI